eukprot:6492700-Amphidinium_carterae.5
MIGRAVIGFTVEQHIMNMSPFQIELLWRHADHLIEAHAYNLDANVMLLQHIPPLDDAGLLDSTGSLIGERNVRSLDGAQL